MKPSVSILAVTALFCANTHGETGNSRRWSISAGVKTRHVDYAFEALYEAPDDWQSAITPFMDTGSSELHSGDRGEWAVYEDGWVYGTRNGLAYYWDGGVLSRDHWTRLDDGSWHQNRFGSDLGGVWEFHSAVYSAPVVDDGMGHSSQSGETEDGPYVKTGYLLADLLGGHLNISLLGSASHHNTGDDNVHSQTVAQERTEYEFEYQEVDFGFLTSYIVTDSSVPTIEGPTPLIDLDYPRRTILSQETVLVATLNRQITADLEIDWYELTLGLDWSRSLFNRLDVYLLLGATMQALDWELVHSTSWTVDGQDAPFETSVVKGDDTEVLIGAVGEIGINLFLDSKRRFFIEAAGEYLYLEKVSLNAGPASVEIDGESWSGKVGVGVFL